jgi:hypothetical protein
MAHAMSEDELLEAIIDAARLYGWHVHHDRRSDRAITQGHIGFPDLVLARRGKVLFMELKTQTGQLSPDQYRWLEALGIDAMVVRPALLDQVIHMLK